MLVTYEIEPVTSHAEMYERTHSATVSNQLINHHITIKMRTLVVSTEYSMRLICNEIYGDVQDNCHTCNKFLGENRTTECIRQSEILDYIIRPRDGDRDVGIRNTWFVTDVTVLYSGTIQWNEIVVIINLKFIQLNLFTPI